MSAFYQGSCAGRKVFVENPRTVKKPRPAAAALWAGANSRQRVADPLRLRAVELALVH